MRPCARLLRTVGVVLSATLCSQSPAISADGPVAATAALANNEVQEDFPAVCLDQDDTPWVAYVEYDNRADRLKLARNTTAGLRPVGILRMLAIHPTSKLVGILAVAVNRSTGSGDSGGRGSSLLWQPSRQVGITWAGWLHQVVHDKFLKNQKLS